eukprot:s708_g32.t1
MSDLRSRLERKEDDGPRKLLMPERIERLRLERAKRTLTGVTIDTQLEPAHRLVDLAVQQAEDSTIKYIELKDCLSRESELMHSKTEPSIEFQSDGAMKLSKKQIEIKAETSGDLKVKMAMQRRALAYHIAGICTYQTIDALIQRMFALMTKEPVKGFRAVSLQQVINADREMWILSAQEARGKTLTDPTKPLNDILESAFKAPETSYHLLPLPIASGKIDSPHGQRESANAGGKGDHGTKRPAKGGGFKGNKKFKGKGKGIDLPSGCVAETGAGQRICFQFNRKRCNHQEKDREWRPYLDQHGDPVFPTKTEAAYPELLCRRVAALVKQEAVNRGTQVQTSAYVPQGAQEESRMSKRHGWAALPPLVAEYKLVTDTQPDEAVHFKLLSTLPNWGKQGSDSELGDRGTAISVSSNFQMGDPIYGVYRTHAEFLQAALQAKHPIDFACSFPEVLMRNIAKVLSEGPKLVIAHRKLEVLKVKRLALQLEEEEHKLHQGLHPEMAKLLQGKRLLLVWKEFMQQTGFDDPSLFEETLNGFKLVGQAKVSPQFPRGFASMQQTPDELRRKSIWMRKANQAKCKPSGRAELDNLVWQQTLDECEAGLIDDALASGLNSAFGTSNKLTLFDIDTLVAMVLQSARAIQMQSGSLLSPEGAKVDISVSSLWSKPLKLCGRTLDLQSAYKPAGPYMDDLWNRIIMVYDPNTDCARYFVSSALMFGSTAAVYAFNRISRSLWHIMSQLLSLWMAVYHDDFPMVEPEETAESAEQCMAEILDILGWKFARSGHKAPPFAPAFDVLGVTVDLSGLHSGTLELRNKSSRVEALTALLDKLVCDGRESRMGRIVQTRAGRGLFIR